MVFGEGNEHKVGQSEAEWSIGFLFPLLAQSRAIVFARLRRSFDHSALLRYLAGQSNTEKETD